MNGCIQIPPPRQIRIRFLFFVAHLGLPGLSYLANEIFTPTCNKVNAKEGYIGHGYADTKTKQKRRVFLTDEVSSVLSGANRVRNLSHKFVFTRRGAGPVKSIRTAFRNACRRAGIPDFVIHDLRHYFVTNMRKAGVHDSVIMTQTGHKTMSMFLRYNNVDESDGTEAVQKLSGYPDGTMQM